MDGLKAVKINELSEIFRSEKLVRQMVKAGWLKPLLRRHRQVLFDDVDVRACWQRLKEGEVPPPL